MNAIELLNKGVYSLNLKEAEFLLNHYKNHENSYLYETKIRSIERAIEKLNKPKEEPAWMALAREDVATKKKWRELGATSRDIENMQIWYYQGEQFYMWISGEHVNKSTPRLRNADKLLRELLSNAEVESNG